MARAVLVRINARLCTYKRLGSRGWGCCSDVQLRYRELLVMGCSSANTTALRIGSIPFSFMDYLTVLNVSWSLKPPNSHAYVDWSSFIYNYSGIWQFGYISILFKCYKALRVFRPKSLNHKKREGLAWIHLYPDQARWSNEHIMAKAWCMLFTLR